ncbi:hypothetical protein PVAND_008088 [Polypedilum vanderplanki]|uniref:Uncharacterized protein n=1 Tax=Polypedilum vanderplanki TaxID=319348 RepID=A0A9J6C915_POLVA|nr:hypothetical protein PVAND_008088 [Polypedilum vanderplanki]
MDLAEQIDDFIPSVQSSHSEMDSLIMLLFILLITSLFLLWLGKFLYQKYVINKAVPSTSSSTNTATSSNITSATSSLLAQRLTASPLNSAAGGAKSGGSSSVFGSSPVRRGSGGNLPSANPSLLKTRSMSQQPNAGVRKRLTRRSPGPELPNQRRSRSIPPPEVTGPDDTTSTWASHVFKWLYSDLVIVNDLLYGFITAINQTMARNTSEEKMLIEVVRLLPESTVPNISNIFCDKPTTSNVSEVVVTMDIETTLVLQVKAFRQVSGKADVLHYRVNVRFRGHLSVTMNYTALVGEMRIEGYPDIKITIASIGPIKTNGKEEKEIQDMICESLNLTIRDTLYPVDFSIHATCPRAMKMEPDEYYDHQSMDFPNPYDYMSGTHIQNRMPYDQSSMREMNQSTVQMTSGRRLLVKIVKGDGLMQAKDPYCVVEMDEPPQKNQTGSRQGSNPFWDEHFLFDLSHASSEILFEVYDRPNDQNDYPKFLGLGLVGVDELAVGPSSSQVIGLQPRPYETQSVSGAITVEFVFIEGAQVPTGRRPYKLKEALKLDPHQQEQQMYGYDQPPISPARLSPMLQRQQQPHINGHNSSYMIENPNISRTTSPSHDINSLRPINYSSPQRHSNSNVSVPNSSKQYPYDNSNSQSQSPTSINNKMPITSTPNKPNSLNVKISMIQQQQNESNKETSIEPISANLSDRGRERKKTTIFGTLRKRLSRSKTRNEELTNGNASSTNNTTTITNGYNESHQQLSPHAPQQKYSSSFDSSNINPTLITTQSKNLTSPTGTLNRFGISGSSRRSSVSEMSGLSRLSSISNKTFLHEASSLVLEVIENGVRRHYLVPLNIAQKPRWRRKGTKLHIYNDHTFVAKHLPSGLICEICMLSIPFRMGKQGYECRDCFLKCHKQCHVRTPRLCPKPTIQSIELSNLPVLKDF